MNTKTMRLPPRRVLTPSKRKEREDPSAILVETKPSSTFTKLPLPHPTQAKATATKPDSSSNQLLAGYLAHEYLTKGTLFGRPFDPAQSQAQVQHKKAEAEPSRPEAQNGKYQKRYVEIATLLKTDGAHIPGVVNPTQLARFLQT